MSFGEHDEEILRTLVEIRDGIRQLVALVSRGGPAAPPRPTRSPREVSCPYCKAETGQSCNGDIQELPLAAADGLSYHASRMRLVGLWPPRGQA